MNPPAVLPVLPVSDKLEEYIIESGPLQGCKGLRVKAGETLVPGEIIGPYKGEAKGQYPLQCLTVYSKGYFVATYVSSSPEFLGADFGPGATKALAEAEATLTVLRREHNRALIDAIKEQAKAEAALLKMQEDFAAKAAQQATALAAAQHAVDKAHSEANARADLAIQQAAERITSNQIAANEAADAKIAEAQTALDARHAALDSMKEHLLLKQFKAIIESHPSTVAGAPARSTGTGALPPCAGAGPSAPPAQALHAASMDVDVADGSGAPPTAKTGKRIRETKKPAKPLPGDPFKVASYKWYGGPHPIHPFADGPLGKQIQAYVDGRLESNGVEAYEHSVATIRLKMTRLFTAISRKGKAGWAARMPTSVDEIFAMDNKLDTATYAAVQATDPDKAYANQQLPR
eukprot:gene18486-24984_t